MSKIFVIYCFILYAIYASQSLSTNSYKVHENSKIINETGISFNVYKTENTPISTSNPEISKIAFSMDHIDKHVSHIYLKDYNEQRWEVPELCNDWKIEYFPDKFENSCFEYTIEPFTMKFKDHTGNEFIEFFTDSLQYSDKLIVFDVLLQTNRLFGLGERAAHFAMAPGTYTMWNHGAPNPFDDGIGGRNIYGSHPFYVSQTADKSQFFAVWFKNSNAQDAIISLTTDKRYRVTHKSVGGIIELFVFYPNKLELVLQKYHILVGRPYLPAFWSMGSHQCRWGYRSIWDIKRILRGYESYEIPLDAITIDIDYMIDYEIFTVDKKRYPGFKELVENMHSDDQQLVLILDPGIKILKGYHVYDDFVKKQALIKSVKHPPFAEGNVWPGATVFPDFFNVDAVELWKSGLKELWELVPFDGMMLDMLDIESFCNGECPIAGFTHNIEENKAEDPQCIFDKKNHPVDEFDNLPYHPGDINLEAGTMSVTGYHCAHNEYEDKNLKEFNTHNLFSYNETKITSDYHVELTGKRTFMLPRSTTPGSGHYSSHWQGDNFATWSHLRLSVAGLFSYQLFGTPHVGSDMCGFTGNGDAELCARWYQVGAFYTFTRNHNIRSVLPQEPWWFYENSEHDPHNMDGKMKISVIDTAKNTLRQKYSLLRLYYTNMISAHLKGGYVVGPIFFEFPKDDIAFKELENSLLIGKSVLVSFALHPGQKQINQYLPNQDFFELYTGKRVSKFDPKAGQKGTFIKLDAKFDKNHLHLMGGSIIPYQDTTQDSNLGNITRAKKLLENPLEIIVGLSSASNNIKAHGEIIIEDGITPKIQETKKYKHFVLEFSSGSGTDMLLFTNVGPQNNDLKLPNEIISKISVYGLDSRKTYKSAVLQYNDGRIITLNANFDKKLEKVIINMKNPEIKLGEINRIIFLETVELINEQKINTDL